MVAASTWQCADCDTYNDGEVPVCHVCETPRAATRRVPPEPPSRNKAVPEKSAGTRKTAAAKKAATSVRGLVWECPLCRHRVVDGLRCGRCGTRWSVDARLLPGETLFGTTPAPVRTPPGEATRGEVVAGCGCLLFLAAAIITPIVLLVLHWSTVTSFVTGSGSSDPSPAPSASGPCPAAMAALLPEGTGARLVAAYSRDTLEERYAFCRTEAGKVFFFARAKEGEPYGTPTEATESEDGYVVDFMPQGTSYHFRDGHVVAYDEDGEELWKGELVPEASAG